MRICTQPYDHGSQNNTSEISNKAKNLSTFIVKAMPYGENKIK
jgi:hypothetical protein